MTSPPAFRHNVLPGGLKLATLSSPKLKTIIIKAFIAADLDESVTERALLPMVLRRGTRRLPDMQLLTRYLEGLYGAGLWSSASKVGEWHITKHRLEVVNDRFLPSSEGLFDKALDFLREFLTEPREVDGGFDPRYVEQEKETLRRNIESLIDDKSSYAAFRCVEEMCAGEPYRFHEQGRVDALDAITASELFENSSRSLRECPLSIYIAGDFDEDAVLSRVEKLAKLPREEERPLRALPQPVSVGEVREVRERLDVSQGKLVVGFRHGVTYSDDEYEALLVMNGILGGFSHSKLFQNVRERASLAYSASSGVERSKGLLFVSCGIAPENYEQALKISLEQVDAMTQGDVSDDEIEATIKTIMNHNCMLEDNIAGLADTDYAWSLHGRNLDLARFRERLLSVSRDAVVEVARKLAHDTTYFLHG